MNESHMADDLTRQIRESAGQVYLDRTHQRSFSRNVFQMNAVELVEAAQRIKDPDQGMALMMMKNHEAGRQAHRELSRHVHNFVSSALTLVEHTRVFMRKHYTDTEVMAAYEKQVETTFAQSPVAQFVQGLRNYMLHRGLPSSSMFMKFTKNPDTQDGAGTTETGAHYDTASLLDWRDWKPKARAYLEQAGEELNLHNIVEEYLTLVNQFHGWLDATLAAHHWADLQELRRLEAQLEAISPEKLPKPAAQVKTLDAATVKPFEFTPQQMANLDRMATDLLHKVRKLQFRRTPQGFPTERPTTSIKSDDLVGPMTFWGREVSGQWALSFIHSEDKTCGLLEVDFNGVEGLINNVMSSAWARGSLSRDFVGKTFIDWARERFKGNGPPFAEALSAAARGSVTAIEVWAPIANMEVEQNFKFGPVRIEPITAAFMENLRCMAPAGPEYEQQVTQFFDNLKRDIQGHAAVVVSLEAEPMLAKERGFRLAQDAIGLLRFFSSAGPTSFLFSPVALAGADYIPTSKLIMLHEGGASINQGILPKHIGYWRLAKRQIAELESGRLGPIASLVVPEGLSEFALAVRASILSYSKGTTLVDPLDRLRNCLSALEGVLLRHEMEPRAHSVANRMSVILARRGANREAVKQVVQQVYWLQGHPQLAAQGRREDELLRIFTSYAYDALRVTLVNSLNFKTRAQFVMGVDSTATVSQ